VGVVDDDWQTSVEGAIIDMLFAVELLVAKSGSSWSVMQRAPSVIGFEACLSTILVLRCLLHQILSLTS